MSQNSNHRQKPIPCESEPKMDDWLENLEWSQLRRSEMNQLIMEYLIHEGFKEAAERFKIEAGIQMPQNSPHSETPDAMERRIQVRNAIEEGRILEAMKLINEYYPELIDDHRHLYFKLQQQQLIELIRGQHVEEALKFAQEQLSVDGDYLQLPELERTLALLAFDKPESSPYADLLQCAHRQQLASQVNEAILQEQSGEAEMKKPQLVSLLKLLVWTQSELDRKKVKYPKMTDIANATIAAPPDA